MKDVVSDPRLDQFTAGSKDQHSLLCLNESKLQHSTWQRLEEEHPAHQQSAGPAMADEVLPGCAITQVIKAPDIILQNQNPTNTSKKVLH